MLYLKSKPFARSHAQEENVMKFAKLLLAVLAMFVLAAPAMAQTGPLEFVRVFRVVDATVERSPNSPIFRLVLVGWRREKLTIPLDADTIVNVFVKLDNEAGTQASRQSANDGKSVFAIWVTNEDAKKEWDKVIRSHRNPPDDVRPRVISR
jgi:hypothetical protein